MSALRRTLLSLAASAALCTLSACGPRGGDNLAEIDNEIAGNDADPALTSALQDQILVDPTLAQQSNRNAVRTPDTPAQAQYPVTQPAAAPAPGQPAVQQASVDTGGATCGAGPFEYDLKWASRMSAAFPVLPGSKISDGAANNQNGCRVRVATFATAQNFQRVLDWYSARAAAAGYTVEHQVRAGDHILGGTNAADGGAYFLIVTPKGNGAEVALMANQGR